MMASGESFLFVFATLVCLSSGAPSTSVLCQNPRRAFYLRGIICKTVKVDCEAGSWGSWTRSTTRDCVETRARGVSRPARNGGKPCNALKQTRKCTGTTSDSKTDARRALRILESALGGFRQDAKGNSPSLQETPLLSNRASGQSAKCPKERDVVLVVECSKATTALDDLNRLLPHLCGLQSDVASCNSVRLALVTYGVEPSLVFDLKQRSQTDVRTALAKSRCTSYGNVAAMGDALSLVSSRVLQLEHGMRRDSSKTILLVSDTKSRERGREPVVESGRLYAENEELQIVAIGIGDKNSKASKLETITRHKSPSHERVVLVHDFATLGQTVDKMISLFQR